MDPLVASSLVSTGSGLFGGLFNIGAGRRQRKWQKKFWAMQNEYNHPKNQMARLKEAGLNPALMYGNSASPGIAGDVGNVERDELNVENPLQHLTKFADTRLRSAQASNEDKRGTLLVQEAALKASETAKKNLENAATKADWDVARDLARSSAEAAQQALKINEQKIIGMELDNSFKDQTLKNRVSDIYYRVQNARATLTGQNLTNALRKEQLELKKLGIEPSDFAPLRWLVQGKGNLSTLADEYLGPLTPFIFNQ